MYVVPKPGLNVPDPAQGDYLPEGGREVANPEYWLRRKLDGDVTILPEEEKPGAQIAQQIVAGAADERPIVPREGMFRYNLTTKRFEGYGGEEPGWNGLGGAEEAGASAEAATAAAGRAETAAATAEEARAVASAPRAATGWRITGDWIGQRLQFVETNAAGQIAAYTDRFGVGYALTGGDYLKTDPSQLDGVAKSFRLTGDWGGVRAVEMAANAIGQIVEFSSTKGVYSEWGGASYVSPIYSIGGDGEAGDVALPFSRPRATGDWANIRATAIEANAGGQYAAFTVNGVRQEWRGTYYGAVLAPLEQAFNAPASYPVQEMIGREVARALRLLGYNSNETPLAKTGADTNPPVLSRDKATYWPYHAWQIPCGARVGQREFYATYGRNDLPPGAKHSDGNYIGGEGAPCYVALEVTDDYGITVSAEAFIVPRTPLVPGSEFQGVLDPHLFTMPNGMLAILTPVAGASVGAGAARAVYGCLLTNPLAAPADWVFGPFCYLGGGFVGKPSMHGGEVRFTTAQTVPNGAIYRRLRTSGEGGNAKLISERISAIPEPSEFGFTRTFAEASHVPFGRDGVLLYQRCGEGILQQRSYAGGEEGSWSAPVLLPWMVTGASRGDLLRSPSGRLIYLQNPAMPSEGNNRIYAAAHISEDDGETFPWRFMVDPRRRAASYFSGFFGAHLDGSYNGKVIDMYDVGRNKVFLPGGPAGETLGLIARAEFDEESVVRRSPIPAIIRERALPI